VKKPPSAFPSWNKSFAIVDISSDVLLLTGT
jgi:hypothetical protein